MWSGNISSPELGESLVTCGISSLGIAGLLRSGICEFSSSGIGAFCFVLVYFFLAQRLVGFQTWK